MEEKKEVKKEKSMVAFFFRMVFLFILIGCILIDEFLVAGAIMGISTAKWGTDFLVEGLRAAFIIIVLLAFGNKYIFTEKREKFKDSVLLGWPMLLLGGFYLVDSILTLRGTKVDINAVINCIVLCFLIGVFEEFMCRGWLQNEFIERFKKNKHQVIMSIVLSSLVFGLMHITNIWASNQGVFGTIMQIMQATAAGVFLGSIYYKTKNIWSVVFIHAFYDFTIFIGEAGMLRDCEPGIISTPMKVYDIVISLVIIAAFIIGSIIILRSEVGVKLLRTDTKTEVQNRKLAIITILLIIIANIEFPIPGSDEAEICFNYLTRELPENYRLTEVTNSSPYSEIHYNDLVFTVEQEQEENGKFYIKDTKGTVSYFDFTIDLLYVLEHYDSFEVIAVKQDNTTATAYYFTIRKSEMKNDHKYLSSITESVKKYELPYIARVGNIENLSTGEKEILLRGQYKTDFVIDENGKLYNLKNE